MSPAASTFRSPCGSKKPQLVFKDTPSNRSILTQCQTLFEEYNPSWYFCNGHVQTLLSARGSANPKVKYERQLVNVSDGGLIALDWAVHPTKTYPNNHPTILIHHGAGGSSRDTYVRITAKALVAAGWRVVAMNMRGCGNTPLVTPRIGNGFHTKDIRDVISLLRDTVVPTAPFIGIGFSAGGNLIVKHAGEVGDACQLSAIVSISNPYDMNALDKLLYDNTWNFHVYNKNIASAIKRHFYKNRDNVKQFEGLPKYDMEALKNAKDMRELDSLVSCIAEGYDNLDEYYRGASSVHHMSKLAKPTLCISAVDDPLCPPENIPERMCQENDNIIIVKTHTGGHLGFFTDSTESMWTTDVIVEYVEIIVGRLDDKLSTFKEALGAFASSPSSNNF